MPHMHPVRAVVKSVEGANQRFLRVSSNPAKEKVSLLGFKVHRCSTDKTGKKSVAVKATGSAREETRATSAAPTTKAAASWQTRS